MPAFEVNADLTILNQRKIFALDMRVNGAERSERNVKTQWRKFDDFKSEENLRSCHENERNGME